MNENDESKYGHLRLVHSSDTVSSPFTFNRDGIEVGRSPDSLSPAELGMLPYPDPLVAIAAYCIECSGGDGWEACDCTNTTCPLWLFRAGLDPFEPIVSEAKQ